MSITAFPVMARILKDRQMTQTTIGRLALTSAAVADVLAWVHARAGRRARRQRSRLESVRAHGRRAGCAERGAVSRRAGRCSRDCIARYAADGRPEGALLAALLIGTFACAYVDGHPASARRVRRVPVRRLPAARRSAARRADRAHRVRRDPGADAGVLRARRPEHDAGCLRRRGAGRTGC